MTDRPSLTNTITVDVWEGIRARHSLVESAGQPTEAARAMAYLSHLDRRDLIAEVERLKGLISLAYHDEGTSLSENTFSVFRDELKGFSPKAPSHEPGASPNDAVRWICPKCTTVNGIDDPICSGGSCGTRRPEKSNPAPQAKCLRDVGFNMQCQEPEGHVGPCRWHRPTAFG